MAGALVQHLLDMGGQRHHGPSRARAKISFRSAGSASAKRRPIWVSLISPPFDVGQAPAVPSASATGSSSSTSSSCSQDDVHREGRPCRHRALRIGSFNQAGDLAGRDMGQRHGDAAAVWPAGRRACARPAARSFRHKSGPDIGLELRRGAVARQRQVNPDLRTHPTGVGREQRSTRSHISTASSDIAR